MNCRGCGATLTLTFLDLGMSPIANDLISAEKVNEPEVCYPLHVMTCLQCALVQLPEIASRESLFRSDYVYFSSYSTSWLEHSWNYVMKMVDLLKLSSSDLVIEVASNDGYLLQYFNQRGIQILGVEPSSGVAQVAIEKGLPTHVEFFGAALAAKLASHKKPTLMLGNNVLAHVPDIHDFIEGFAVLIADDGLITFEFPHLVSLLKNTQFDTIYHEHYSYLSVTSLIPIFQSHGLRVIKVEKLPTHGGSIRVYVAKIASGWEVEASVEGVLTEELQNDPRNDSTWRALQKKTLRIKADLISELSACKKQGLKVAAYGAAAKGNTLLNYSGVTSDLVDYVVDLNPHKQGNFLPGSKIPIVGADQLVESPPDVLLLLPWNLAEEVKAQLSDQIGKGLKLLRAIPELEYF
jgi:SAM-dependent methyltransferase